MVNHIESAQAGRGARAIRKVMVLTPYLGYCMPEGLLAAINSEVVVIESIERAYSQVKRVAPHLVIVCLSMDDVNTCRALSMLQLDPETSHIPVVTCTTSAPDRGVGDSADADPDMFGPRALAA
jgi:CheY-like chemotaxis protein